MKSRSAFLYFGDKNVNKVSGIWKALHISIYIAAAVNAFITSMAAGNMFQTFKYNCILFCNEMAFEKEVVASETFFMTHTLDQSSEESANGTDVLVRNFTEFSYKNETHIFHQIDEESIEITQAKIDIRKTIFPRSFWCNYVLGMALVTFIFATFCSIILAMCSRGGKGRNNTLNRPQNMVYPILFSSILLGVLNAVASIMVKNGMSAFCASFEQFTNDKSCSSVINKFTIHERQGNFYLPYVVLSYTFNVTVILFVGQIIVTFLRIIYAVDYQLYALEVDENTEEEDRHNFDVEDGQIVRERTL
ncbi:unnamed protein product [Ceutorhynchus assimilis]|uniref:Uncharacterized protein n=1 Tax=Ceutorhynchus assimilis TaxID=467358 RepID=A0A9N9QE75_9CUCU|nr:unnamed protein product [Ceutorhynchus assimilis]